jgi:hypothetical protein
VSELCQSYLRFFSRGYLPLPLVAIPSLTYIVSYCTGTDATGLFSFLGVFYPRLACDLEAVSSYAGYNGDAYVGSILLGIASCLAFMFVSLGNLVVFGHRQIRKHVGRENLSKRMMALAVIMSLPLSALVFMMHSYLPTINGSQGGCSWLGRGLPPSEFAQQFWFSLFLSGWLLFTLVQLAQVLIVHFVGLFLPVKATTPRQRIDS